MPLGQVWPWRCALLAGLTAALLTCALSSTARATDPVLAAVGDIACAPGTAQTSSTCQQGLTSSLLQSNSPTAAAELGDEQYDQGLLSEYQKAYDPTWGVPPIKSISHPVPGNHEYEQSPSAAGYFSYFGSAAGPTAGYYSYELGGWHVIALNSNCADSGKCANFDNSPTVPGSGGKVTTAETQWLANDLAAHQGECTLAYWHHPLFSVGSVGPSPDVKPLWDALYSHGADVVLNGHDHVYERYVQQDPMGAADSSRGIREFVSGEGGKDLPGFPYPLTRPTTLEATDPSPTAGAGHFSVLFLTLHRGGYEWRLKATDGTVLDSSTASTTCHEPQATPAALPATPTTQQQVSFSANASDPSNQALTYSWDFGDPGSATNIAATASPTHSYATAGSRNVTLTVTNTSGVATTKSLALAITDRPPTAQFSAPGNAPPGTSLTFDARGSSDPDGTIADPAGYRWDFGDGTSAGGSTAQHAYRTPGTYHVTLTVTDNSASTSSVTHDVTVTQVPAPIISSPSDGSYNNRGAVTLVGTASPGSTVTALEGATSQGSTLADSHGNWSKAFTGVLDGPHTYSARAAIGSGASSPSSAMVRVTVDTVPPRTSITSGPSAPTHQPGASFGFTSSEAGSTFQCRLTGPGQAGAFSACSSPVSYGGLSDGAYTFTVRATDPAGNTDTTPPTRSFTVRPSLSLRPLPERLGRVLAHGLRAVLASNVTGPARVRLDFLSTRRKGRNRRASTFPTRLSGATVWLAGAGRENRLTLRFDRSARRHLRRRRRVTLRVTATLTDAAGSRATSARRVELRR